MAKGNMSDAERYHGGVTGYGPGGMVSPFTARLAGGNGGGSMGSRIPFRPNMPPGPGNVNAMGNGPMLGTGGDPYWSQDAVRRRGGNTGVFGGPYPGLGNGGILGGKIPFNPNMGGLPGARGSMDNGPGGILGKPNMGIGRVPSPYQPGTQMPRVPMTNPSPIQGPGYGTGSIGPQFDMNQILQQIAQKMGGMQQGNSGMMTMGGYGR